MTQDQLKKEAAEKAVEQIKDGMIVGLGTGSTFQYALEKIGKKVNSGELKDIICVSSSIRTEHIALRLGIPLISLNDLCNSNSASSINHQASRIQLIDVTIDGADEVDEHLNLIKGGGGALLREKIIVQASKNFFVIVDESKLSKVLGTNFALPIELIPLALNIEKKFIESLGAVTTLRKNNDGNNYITDENNFILDAKFESIPDVNKLSSQLNERAGIVEHGIFSSNLVTKIFCAYANEVKEIVH
jgi:ribose 5-phosphate isomerase A